MIMSNLLQILHTLRSMILQMRANYGRRKRYDCEDAAAASISSFKRQRCSCTPPPASGYGKGELVLLDLLFFFFL